MRHFPSRDEWFSGLQSVSSWPNFILPPLSPLHHWVYSGASVSVFLESSFSKNLANQFRENLHPRYLITLNIWTNLSSLIIPQSSSWSHWPALSKNPIKSAYSKNCPSLLVIFHPLTPSISLSYKSPLFFVFGIEPHFILRYPSPYCNSSWLKSIFTVLTTMKALFCSFC